MQHFQITGCDHNFRSFNLIIVMLPIQILAVGADPVLSRFDINGMILTQIHCASQSAFSVSLHPSGVTAMGGYGDLVDVISQFGSHLCTFRSHCV
ncbi:THO complex subunit 6-like [Durio zibethinus]|uniref:THO complex subunit 6-like n=1 Tax=Durio zibethinus TaxID=66656 RepID=A0A6P5XLJ2_DURZI|nr:THO complex subunit 6-like [Durio zibethinus]